LLDVPGPPSSSELLTGWGRTSATRADVVSLRDRADVARAVAAAGPRGVVARGLARSYGDPAQNAGGSVLDMTGLDRITAIDLATGTVTCDAGVSLETLMLRLLPFGWFVHVTPGTRQVTVGGAIAADVHGKSHHVSGSFCSHVVAFDLRTPDGSLHSVTPDGDPEVFWATAGGMGLTGVIESATLRLKRVETSYLSVDTERATDLDDLMARLQATDEQYSYSAAWIDTLARGRSMGRAVLSRGDNATLDQLPEKKRRDPLRFGVGLRPSAPGWVPPGLLNVRTVGLFNEAWYRKNPRERRGEIQTMTTFFHPLDAVVDWNRVYGPRGFLQYQFVVPYGQEAAVQAAVEKLSAARSPAFLAVLKRFGEGNPGHLSFPAPGWTLALDVPTAMPGLAGLLDSLDDLVLEAGGRIYLAKDSRLPPELLPAMYPRLDEWRQIRAELDPDGVLQSDLSRRLSL
jgi:decaprenylphospho-beta-D-ribofuranose 2-oxidase